MMTVQNTLQFLHVLAGLIVLMEALNKLERTAPFARGLTPHHRVVDGLKALAWSLLALGAAGALAGPWLQPIGAAGALAGPWLQPIGEHIGMVQFFTHITQPAPSLADVCALGGFAILIIRTRIKEG